MKMWTRGTITAIDFVEIAKDNSKFSLVNSEISGGMVPSYLKITCDQVACVENLSCDG
jgi:hypothetical protein